MKWGKRIMALGLCLCLSFAMPIPREAKAVTLTVKAAKEGWVKKSGKTYYYVKGKKVKGVYKVGKKLYAFDSKGVLQGKTQVFVWKNKYYQVSKKGVAKQWKGTSALAAKVISGFPAKATENAKLILSFTYCRDLTYLRVSAPAGASEEATAEYYGKIGLSQGVGDCSVQAYSFYYLAKVLGYDVKVVNGYTKSTTFNEHSWVELTKSKKAYVCDPNFSKEYADEVTVTGKYPLGMLVRYGAKNTLKYFRMDQSEILAYTKA